MAKICEICGKKPLKASTYKKIRSKYNPTNTYFQKPNLQKVKLPNGKKIRICTSCWKKMKKELLAKTK
ncbi:MAG: bL28 family ribosomal protein [Candidatus Paceibacterota bacterium]